MNCLTLFHWKIGNCTRTNKTLCLYFEFADYDLTKSFYIQLNLHETDLLFQYLSHHLTWQCSSISEDLHRFARNLQHLLSKLFLLLFLNNFITETIAKTILWANAANFLQICANLKKYWKIAMSNDVCMLVYSHWLWYIYITKPF